MNLIPIDPRTLGIPHDSWRDNQYLALESIMQELTTMNNRFAYLELPTGSGKSAIATALGQRQQVTVLVGTLNLLHQYRDAYGFDIIEGRQNYECTLTRKVQQWSKHGRTPTAADCGYSPMHECPASGSCPYLSAKEIGLNSNRLAVTYKYAFLSRKVRERPGVLVCDECHESVEQIVSFSTFKVSEGDVVRDNLPPLPLRDYMGSGGIVEHGAAIVLGRWLMQCAARYKYLLTSAGDVDTYDPQRQRIERKGKKFDDMLQSLDSTGWFLRCMDDRGEVTLELKALDAATIAKRLWDRKQFTVLMSATIGDPAPLSKELGISRYSSKTYPHPVPAEFRPVFDLGVPKMTWKALQNDPGLFNTQAQAISRWVREYPAEWRGIVLTSSYAKIQKLDHYLQVGYESLRGRKFITQGSMNGYGVKDYTKMFINSPGAGDVLLASVQGFGHGLDLKGDLARWAVVGGVPHTNPRDRYEQLRRKRNGKYGWWKAYNTVVQSIGRVSRGERENGEWLLNVAAIADGSALTPTAMRYYPEYFKEAIREWRQ
jgi:Rad3-related DNA helicase